MPRTKAEYNRRNAALLREPELAREIRTLRQERDEARGKLKALERSAPDARMRAVAQDLWTELSNAVGWLYLLRDALPREDIILNKRRALEAGKALGLGEE